MMDILIASIFDLSSWYRRANLVIYSWFFIDEDEDEEGEEEEAEEEEGVEETERVEFGREFFERHFTMPAELCASATCHFTLSEHFLQFKTRCTARRATKGSFADLPGFPT
jgi:hypothetical protein